MKGENIYEDLEDYLYCNLNFPASSRYGFDEKLWGFCCDGVYWPHDAEYSKKLINDKGSIELNIDFGQTGQEPYTLILCFGRKALRRNAKGLDLRECVPDFAEEPDLISIDTENKVVEIQLK